MLEAVDLYTPPQCLSVSGLLNDVISNTEQQDELKKLLGPTETAMAPVPTEEPPAA